MADHVSAPEGRRQGPDRSGPGSIVLIAAMLAVVGLVSGLTAVAWDMVVTTEIISLGLLSAPLVLGVIVVAKARRRYR